MRNFQALCLALLTSILSTAPALAQDNDIYARSGDWTIREMGEYCQIQRDVGASGRLTFSKAATETGLLRYRTDGPDYDHPFRHDVIWEFDSAQIKGRYYGSPIYGPFDDSSEIEIAFGQSHLITLRDNGETVAEIPLAGSAAAFGLLEECAAQWPKGRIAVVPPRMPPLVRPAPLPITEPNLEGPFPPNRAASPISPGRWVAVSDYPLQALREERGGRAAIALSINANGRVDSCAITESSGHTDLDEATCRLVTARARFEPATDSEGQRVDYQWFTAVRWNIPE